MKFLRLTLFVSLLALLFACRKDAFIKDGSAKLEFSTDTLTFDTVFTSIGSATRQFKIYNPNKKAIKVTDIHLAGGETSSFRLNIDGASTNQARDVEIAGNDSLYIFASVTVDPNNENNPFVFTDSVMFQTNGNNQKVILAAWGQNAHFYYDSVLTTSETWTNDKPYVIINSLLVDTNVTLTIQPGCQVYSHPGSFLFVAGKLRVMGSNTDSVTFQGDRLEGYFQDLPGNWGGIWFLKTSHDNEIHNAVIRDGSFGVRLDSLPEGGSPYKLVMEKTVIKNMLYAGILAVTSTLKATNCLVYNVGQDNCTEMVWGGIYDYFNCTFANYANSITNHQKPTAYMSNYYSYNNQVVGIADLYVTFTNCIIYGNLEKEISLDKYESAAAFNVKLDHCCIKTSDALTDVAIVTELKKDDPLFNNIQENNYKIPSNSPCRDAGVAATGVPGDDLDGQMRDSAIDIGAYEYH